MLALTVSVGFLYIDLPSKQTAPVGLLATSGFTAYTDNTVRHRCPRRAKYAINWAMLILSVSQNIDSVSNVGAEVIANTIIKKNLVSSD